MLLRPRCMLRGILLAWRRHSKTRSSRHRGMCILVNLAHAFLNRRVFTLLAHHAWIQRHRRQHIITPTFHRWNIFAKRQADMRQYAAECAASMAQLRCAIAVNKWIMHIKRCRELHRLTTMATLHRQAVWFLRWRQSRQIARATGRLCHVQNHVRLRRILGHWTRHRRLAHVISATLHRLHAQVTKVYLKAWRQRTDMQLERTAIVITLEDWRVQRCVAQWNALAKAQRHRRVLRAVAASFHAHKLVQNTLRRLEAAAHIQCVRMRRGVDFYMRLLGRRTLTALRHVTRHRRMHRELVAR
ncbi:hypothetical protein AaE_007285, partial [Aphanomyces astaci]